MNFEEMTFKEIKENDLKSVKKYLENNKEYIHYDSNEKVWYIDDDEILDDLWYEMRTKLHPKELIADINIMIENEMKIPKGNQNLADWQADKMDNMIRDTLPDDEV